MPVYISRAPQYLCGPGVLAAVKMAGALGTPGLRVFRVCLLEDGDVGVGTNLRGIV